ncbi:MAG: sodium-translocating pyrophosphatase [Planctomycetota bacterium]
MTLLEPAATLAAIGDIPWLYYFAPIGGIIALLMAKTFSSSVMKQSEGDDEMVRIAQAVREGAMAYLVRQYKVVAGVFVLLLLFLGGMVALDLQAPLTLAGVPIAGLLSGLCGWFGMKMATNASARTAFAAKQSLNDGLTVAFRSGAVMGLVVVGFALLDVSIWFFVLNSFTDFGLAEISTIMLSFGMGASTQALFARVGGGIYTKAADVGADLVGKVEAGIPEDDARNPATIADNVGDNVGDVAGMGADLYESYYGSILATIALGAAAAFTMDFDTAGQATAFAFALAAAPLAIAGLGIFCSVAGIFTVKAEENASFAKLLKGLHKGVYVASALIAVAAFGALWFLLGGANESAALAEVGTTWWRLGLAIFTGLLAGNVIAYATEYYTSYEHKPTQRIAEQALTGPATVIISGIAEGMKSTWASLLVVVIAIIAAFAFAGGADSFLMGLYGVGIAAVGMLSTLGITLATDAYGPIADNAGGNAEMTGQPPEVRERTDMLDSLGNTTAATGKGFAIGSAALTALALFAAYVQVVQTQITTQSVTYVEAANYDVPVHSEPYAVYEGHGKFAVVFPGGGEDGADHIDGAMLVDRTQISSMDYDHLTVGQVLPVEWRSDRSGRGDGHSHGGHDHAHTHDHTHDDGTTHSHEHEHEGDHDHDHSPSDAHEHEHAHDDGTTHSHEHTHEDGEHTHSHGTDWGHDDALIYTISAVIPHGNHSHDLDFEIISSRNGSVRDVLAFYDVTITNPRLLGGIFIGVLLAFLFCALTMNAVGRAAYAMMGECRRQFGIMRDGFRKSGMSEEDIANPESWPKQTEVDGKTYPDYANCVSISTAGAQKEMVVPAVLAIVIPILVGLVLSVPGVMGLLAGGLTSGFAVAVFMANAGGAWDNAKKLLESYGRITADDMVNKPDVAAKVPASVRDAITARAQEMIQTGRGSEYVYGKGSEDHKATVVGDTVGDPFKDTSGPSLNILIKLISVVSVVFAGLIVKYGPVVGSMIGLG